MKKEIIGQLKEISSEEQEILNSGKPVLSFYSVVLPDGENGQPALVQATSAISILKHARFVEFPSHTHNCLEMIYIVSGSSRHTINGNIRLTLETGDLLFLQQGTSHSTAAAGYDDIAVHFLVMPEFLRFPYDMLIEDTVLRRFLNATIQGVPGDEAYLHFHLKDMLEAQNLLENMICILLGQKRNSQRILRLTMAALLLELTNRTYNITRGTPSAYEQSLVLDALSYIENHYRTASLEDFCRQVGQPSYYISRLMKKYSPYTFNRYVQKRRMVQAIYLLTETSMPIEDIIVQVGYENSSHFHRLFKKEFGQSPKAYRTSYLEKL